MIFNMRFDFLCVQTSPDLPLAAMKPHAFLASFPNFPVPILELTANGQFASVSVHNWKHRTVPVFLLMILWQERTSQVCPVPPGLGFSFEICRGNKSPNHFHGRSWQQLNYGWLESYKNKWALGPQTANQGGFCANLGMKKAILCKGVDNCLLLE